jgi:hypothetical protein
MTHRLRTELAASDAHDTVVPGACLRANAAQLIEECRLARVGIAGQRNARDRGRAAPHSRRNGRCHDQTAVPSGIT